MADQMKVETDPPMEEDASLNAGLLSGVNWSREEIGKKSEEVLKEKPYDLESWTILLREAQSDGIDRSRLLYERLVKWFPTSGRFWRLYIEHEVTTQLTLHIRLLR
eukprot:m.21450 g.21450  ORF g.21450 m.21450 type:complete len:106 (+) comp28176_c0_seq1:441-758(+)